MKFYGEPKKRSLSPAQQNTLIELLKIRFENNMNRHENLEWIKIQGFRGLLRV